MMKRNNQSNKGFTLVEIIVSLAIFGLLASIIYPIINFSNRVHVKGENQADIQSGIRLAANNITNRLRTAGDIQIFSDLPLEIDRDPDMIYICLNDEELNESLSTPLNPNTIIAVQGNDGVEVLRMPSIDIRPVMVFSINADSNKAVSFTIECEYKGQHYSVSSDVAAVNMRGTNVIRLESGITSGTVIGYKPFEGDSEVWVPDLSDEEKKAIEDRDVLDLVEANPEGTFAVDGEGNLVFKHTAPNLDKIILPAAGKKYLSPITWESSDESVINSNGDVTRPESDTVEVYLTAAVQSEDLSYFYKQFIVIVEPALDTDPAELTAMPDNYAVAKNGFLSVSEQDGLLANDTGVPGYTMLAKVKPGSEPSSGTLTLNPNGSFTYQPQNGFEGSVFFYYIVYYEEDETISDEGRVIINIGNNNNDDNDGNKPNFELSLSSQGNSNELTMAFITSDYITFYSVKKNDVSGSSIRTAPDNRGLIIEYTKKPGNKSSIVIDVYFNHSPTPYEYTVKYQGNKWQK
jgi:prepilin-type N-terminal cleavage/methylation domain-containing protein